MSAGRVKKRVSRNTIPFWLRSVISMAHASASEEDCHLLRVRAHEVRKVAASLLFKRNCVVHQVLKAGTWSSQGSQLTSAFYPRDVTHRHLDTFSIGPAVAAQQIMLPAKPFGSGVVTLISVFSRWWYFRLQDLHIVCFVVHILLLLLLLLRSSNFDQSELQKPYTQDPLVGT